jgi:Flp pilus assembly CpaE family ATPase
MDIEPLDPDELTDLADSLAAQCAAYGQHAQVHLVDLGAAMAVAAALLLRSNLPAVDALEQWRRLSAGVIELLTTTEDDHGQHTH